MKRKVGIIFLIMIIIATAFTGCGLRNDKSEDSVQNELGYEANTQYKLTSAPTESINDSVDNAISPMADINVNDKIIYTASITLQTEKFNESIEAMEKKVEEVKGYIQKSTINGRGIEEGDPKYAYYVLRIPKASFNYIKKASEQWGNITSLNNDSQDVSEQYFDTEARLETLNIQEERLLNLLKKADKIEDIITIEKELQDVRYQIENYTGSIRRLDSQIEYATITMNIYEVKNVTIVPKTFIQKIGEEIKASAKSFGRFLEGSLISLIYLLPYLLIIIILIIIFRKKIGKIHIGNPIKKIKKNHKE